MPFKKGDPNINRNGRPQGGVSIVDALRRRLEEIEPQEKRMYLDIFVDKIISKSLTEGDVAMMKDVINRIDGMPLQSIQHSGEINTGLTKEQQAKLDKLYDKQGSIKDSSSGDTTGESVSV